MTDEQLDRAIRAADPYRAGVIGRLDGAEQELLEEIMSVPTSVAPPPSRWSRRAPVRRLAGAAAAAAVLAGVVAVAVVQRERPAAPIAAPATSAAAPRPTVMTREMVLKAAESNPRLLIDQPGWKAVTVYGFAEAEGTIAFRNGERELEMTWYPADQYQGYHQDRLAVSAPEAVQVAGQRGDLFRYSDSDFAVMLRPRGDSFTEMRTSANWTRADFDAVLADIEFVDVRTWLAALPPQIVTPDKVSQAAAKVLADVPLPPGFDIASLRVDGANDPYQFGARVTGEVGCGWIAEWLRADRVGDDDARARAAAAMKSSRDWDVLRQMNDEGDWPEAFWQVADDVAAGRPPAGFADALGCA